MRYALLADVHANLPALEAVLAAFRQRGVDRYICAGDVIGYGPHPWECIDAVRALDPLWVLGNHELILLGRLPAGTAAPIAQRALEWTRTVLPPEAPPLLDSLPLTASTGDGIVVTHASLRDTCTRIHPGPLAADELARFEQRHPDGRWLVLGHTHRAMLGNESGMMPWGGRHCRQRLQPAARYIVNPGSVGQSRGFTSRARAALLDTTTPAIELLDVAYDARRVRRDLAAAGLPHWSHHRSPARRFAERVERKLRKLLGQRVPTGAGGPTVPLPLP
jgi:predicted phosphodiesterase